MVAEWVMIGAAIIAASAELLHQHRVRRLASLAFGPGRRPTMLGRVESHPSHYFCGSDGLGTDHSFRV